MCEASIIGAQIFNTRDGHAIDTFRLRRTFTSDEDEKVRATRIIQTVEQLLQGGAPSSSIWARKTAATGG